MGAIEKVAVSYDTDVYACAQQHLEGQPEPQAKDREPIRSALAPRASGCIGKAGRGRDHERPNRISIHLGAGVARRRLPESRLLRTDSLGLSLSTRERGSFETIEHVMFNHYLMVKLSGLTHAERSLDGRRIREVQRRGAVAYVPHGCTHAVRYPGKMGTLCLMTVDDEKVQAIANQIGLTRFQGAEAAANQQDPFLLALAQQIVDELERGNPHGALFADTMAQALALHIVRRYSEKVSPAVKRGPSISSARLRWVLEFIEANLVSPLSLKQLADEAGLTEFHFCRAFRAATGQSPHQYILEKRTEAAAHLLRTENLRLTDIALMTGFPDLSAFGRHFKRRMGQTPSQWRRSVR